MFICVHMDIKNTNGNAVWATEKETAKHYKIKPATLRKHRSLYGHDGSLLYRKIGGSVRYNLDTNETGNFQRAAKECLTLVNWH